jgi:hypothetical protein
MRFGGSFIIGLGSELEEKGSCKKWNRIILTCPVGISMDDVFLVKFEAVFEE